MNFGRKLTQAEYEKAVTSLPYENEDKAKIDARRVAELNLMIDYKLGVDFPADRRAALAEEQSRQDGVRLWHMVKGLVAGQGLDGGLVSGLVKGYAKVLDRDEIGAMLDLSQTDLDKFLPAARRPKGP